jgi:multiple sugar transport system permease protein
MNKRRGTIATVVHPRPGADLALPVCCAISTTPSATTAYTQTNGYLSFGGWTLDNYQNAWEPGELRAAPEELAAHHRPAVLLTLFLSSMVAFVLARFSYRFNLTLLGIFLAANLLPPQALLIPVFKMFREIPLPTFMSESGTMLNSFWALILVNMSPSRWGSARSC